MKTINIIDYGLCNIHSVKSAITKLGYKPNLINNIDGLSSDSKIILPGVGSFANGISRLENMGLIDSIKKHINNQGYFLGICLGMQINVPWHMDHVTRNRQRTFKFLGGRHSKFWLVRTLH